MSNRVSKTISDDILNRIIQIESAGNPTVKAKTSSATGLFQQIDATWLSLVSIHRPDLAIGRTRAQILALRRDPSLNIELGARLTEDNQRIVGKNCMPGDLYLAHFLGPADAKDLFRAAPDTPVAALVSQAAIKANKSILQGKTAGQVRAWAAKAMAKPPKKDWIGLYYTGGKVPLPRPRPEEAPETALEDVSAAAKVEQPLPPEKPAEDAPKAKGDGFFGWAKCRWKGLTSGGLSFSGLSFLAYLTDWRVLATLMAGGTLIGLLIYLIYKREKRA